jgi:hypothetical protein
VSDVALAGFPVQLERDGGQRTIKECPAGEVYQYIIQSVDMVKGSFDPNNIEYLEKELEWNDFKSGKHCTLPCLFTTKESWWPPARCH